MRAQKLVSMGISLDRFYCTMHFVCILAELEDTQNHWIQKGKFVDIVVESLSCSTDQANLCNQQVKMAVTLQGHQTNLQCS